MPARMIPVSKRTWRRLAAAQHDGESLDALIYRLAQPQYYRHPPRTPSRPPSHEARYRPGWFLFRQPVPGRTAIDAYCAVLAILAERTPRLFERLVEHAGGHRRPHFAQTPQDLYPGRLDLQSHARNVASGWFAETNIANRDKARVLKVACEIAGLCYGRDLITDLSA